MKSVGKPDAENRHVRFDERGWETGRPHRSAPAPSLDSTPAAEPKLGMARADAGRKPGCRAEALPHWLLAKKQVALGGGARAMIY
jgi:hypothetical protein